MRTPDNRFWRPVLYQLSYTPKVSTTRKAGVMPEAIGCGKHLGIKTPKPGHACPGWERLLRRR